ncbi:hypothetical protein ACFQBQ_01605 [Granulicella cerasi]|uniref:Uncharacterized protein n=1 Tax=Granulicella cerasi TaxID=741063 RepID=A0ABW1Z6L6_9BACT|nr:hypothetical protein [Granulicella cerasi]
MTSVAGVHTSGPVPANEDAVKHHKLVDAAQQFEAIFLQEMLKSSFGSDESQTESDGANGTMKSLGVESMSKAVATAGGFGVARQIVAKVEAENQKLETGK